MAGHNGCIRVAFQSLPDGPGGATPHSPGQVCIGRNPSLGNLLQRVIHSLLKGRYHYVFNVFSVLTSLKQDSIQLDTTAHGDVAQLVEQRTHKPKVRGSTPRVATLSAVASRNCTFAFCHIRLNRKNGMI